MNHSQEKLERALEAYAAALDEVRPSPQLEARMQAAIEQTLARRRAPLHLRRWGRAIAASIVLTVAAVLTARVLQPRSASEQPEATAQSQPVAEAMRVFPMGAVSLWPTQGTVFRVRSSLHGTGTHQQYWVDVRMANDGSMRIERVFSADGAELFARPQFEAAD
jgi:hypothetical protein